MTEALSITKNGSLLQAMKHSPSIENPIEIKFVIEEKDFIALQNATDYYKWSIYEAFTTFCEFADTFVSMMDFDERFRSNDDTIEDDDIEK